MIPVIGIATCNQKEELIKLISTIDYPVKVVSIICNNYNFDYLQFIRKHCVNNFVEEFIISHCPYNMGCSGSWNYHIKYNPSADYWLLSGDDIQYAHGDLEKFDNIARNNDITFSNFMDKKSGKYSLFAINKSCIKKVGFFDENIYPAYFEDDDYDYRISHHNCTIARVDVFSQHLHMGTIKNIPKEKSDFVNHFWNMNERYYNNKKSKLDLSEGKYSFEERENKVLLFK